ncbi:MAG: hypothetical protein ABJA02_04520 [Acidobacteriota bacterium]
MTNGRRIGFENFEIDAANLLLLRAGSGAYNAQWHPGMNISNVSRRTAAARRSAADKEFEMIVARVCENYLGNDVGNI